MSFDPFPNIINPPEVIFKTTKKEKGTEINFSSYFVDVKAGLFHSVGLTNAGEVYVWGSNQFSQHGISANKLKENANKLNEIIKHNLEFFSTNMLPSLVDTFDIKENKKVTNIACGYEYVFVIQNNKMLYSWGRNTHGQCGIGSVSNMIEEPHLISFFDSHVLKEVVCGENHTLILDDKGDLYACGSSYGGKLGLGFMTTVQTSPKQINLKGVLSVACGPNHSMALVKDAKNKNALYTWGSGWNGELGHGNRDNIYNPKFLETKYNFISISCGTHHSAGITDEQKLAVWGPYKYLGILKNEEMSNDLATFWVPNLHPFFSQSEGLKIISVVLGDKYNIAISSTKEVYFWGVFDITYKKIIKTAVSERTNEEEAYEKKLRNPCKLETDQKFDVVSVSSNHALGISSKHARIYSWGIDGNTGRLGLGYEFTDEELEEENKKIQGNIKKYVGITSYEETANSPILIHFLHYLLNRLSIEAKIKMQSSTDKIAEYKVLNLHKGSSGSNQKLSSNKNITSQQNMELKKSGFVENKKMGSTMQVTGNSKNFIEKSSKISSFLEADINIFTDKKYDLYKTCQSPEKETDNLLNYQVTQSLFHENQAKYQEIKSVFQTVLEKMQQRKKMKKRIVGIILKRISSYPFEAKFISREQKNEKLKSYPQFFKNRKKFQAIFTILQLHPCYLLNIYKSDKLVPDAYFKLVEETFGDLENDNRKIALYINLCQLILKYDVDKFVKAVTAGEIDENEIDLNLDPNCRYYIFVRLFIHLFNSSIANTKWMKFCLKKILDVIDVDIWEKEQSTKAFKQNAIVFRDIVNLSADADKKKIYGDKVKFLISILVKVINEYLAIQVQHSGVKHLEISKHIKRLADKIKHIFMKQNRVLQNLNEDEIQKKILSSVFLNCFLDIKKNIRSVFYASVSKIKRD